MDINEVFINCVDKWTEKGFDDRVNQAIDNFEDWIQAFDEDERNILCEILYLIFDYPHKHYTFKYFEV